MFKTLFNLRDLCLVAVLVLLTLFLPSSLSAQTSALEISWKIPVDVSSTGELTQTNYYHFAWQTFLALNWAHKQNGARGEPDTTKTVNDSAGPAVWETYREKSETFFDVQNVPADPGEWNMYVNSPCPDLPETTKILGGFGKNISPLSDAERASLAPSATQQEIDQATANPLWDQSGEYIRYEIRLNQALYESIRDFGYYDAQAQLNAVAHNTFQNAPYDASASYLKDLPPYAQQGAIVIKASWRILDNLPDALTQRYYKRTGYVIDLQGKCDGPHSLGLVGLHIERPTPKTQVTWFWATFEHVDNVSLEQFTDGLPATATATLNPAKPNEQVAPYEYDPSTVGVKWTGPAGLSSCLRQKPNHFCGPLPVTYLANVYDPKSKKFELDISRVTPIPTEVQQVNEAYQAELQDSVWKYYQLVGTLNPPVNPAQGVPVAFAGPSTIDLKVNVGVLANTTMESYALDTGCLSCHGGAYPAIQYPYAPRDRVFTFLYSKGPSNAPTTQQAQTGSTNK
jgi:hypothetical protein